MSKEKEALEKKVKKGILERYEAWAGERHWAWLVLILVLSGGYVELPNLPIMIDDEAIGFVATVTWLEVGRRSAQRVEGVTAWAKLKFAAFITWLRKLFGFGPATSR